MSNYYSDTYEEARDKFLDMTKTWEQESFEIQKGLYIDTATFNPQSKKNVFVLVSGTHGVEGYVGSAIQLMFANEFIEQINKDTKVVLIHAMNPYGMKYFRRNNENNIDINRAFIKNLDDYKDKDPEMIEIFKKALPIISPRRKRSGDYFEIPRFYILALWYILRYGFSKMKAVLGKGQYSFPNSLGYGGNGERFEKSIGFYQESLRKFSAGMENLCLIDIHTGMSKDYYSTAHVKDSDEFKKWQRIFPSCGSSVSNDSDDMQELLDHIKVTIKKYTVDNSLAKKNYALLIDFGTGPKNLVDTANRAIAENQVFHYGATSKKVEQKVKSQFKDFLYPSGFEERKKLIEKANILLRKVGKEFQLYK